MASSLFGNQSSPLTSQNNLSGMIQQFNQFKQQFGNRNPKDVVNELISSGKMSREQFNQLGEMAKQLSAFLR